MKFARPQTLASLAFIFGSIYLLFEASTFKPASALLPVAMLTSLIVLSVILIVMDQREAKAGTAARISLGSGKAYLFTIGFVVSVSLLGFYPSLVIGLPLIAYVFGFRDLKFLAGATAVIALIIYGLFDLFMLKDFPTGILF